LHASHLRAVAVVAILVALVAAAPVFGKDKAPTTRAVMGHVTGNGDVPLADAVVYLTNTKTADIRTFITDKEGAYHFSALALNVDYQIYAKLKDHKSDTKTLSQFDNRSQVIVNLHIDTQ
jgi:uncharacterized protein with FMN-binding domain